MRVRWRLYWPLFIAFSLSPTFSTPPSLLFLVQNTDILFPILQTLHTKTDTCTLIPPPPLPPFHLFPHSLFLHGKFIWLLSRPGSCNGRQTVATPAQKLRHRETHKHERFQHGHKRVAVSLTGVVDVGDSLCFLRSAEGKE